MADTKSRIKDMIGGGPKFGVLQEDNKFANSRYDAVMKSENIRECWWFESVFNGANLDYQPEVYYHLRAGIC